MKAGIVGLSWAANVDEEANFVELRGTKAGLKYRRGKAMVFAELEGR